MGKTIQWQFYCTRPLKTLVFGALYMIDSVQSAFNERYNVVVVLVAAAAGDDDDDDDVDAIRSRAEITTT